MQLRTKQIIDKLTLTELRDKVRREEERRQAHGEGAYVAPMIPNFEQYKERLRQLEAEEERQQEEQRQQEELELQRQAAQQEVPQVRVVQVQEVQVEVPEIPAIPAEAETVHSSTVRSTRMSGQTSSRSENGRRLQAEEEDEDGKYYDNIVEVMLASYNDGELITQADELHEG
eukprot:4841601-Amphidinium_carterae.1